MGSLDSETEEEQVRTFLKSVKLERYFEAFVENGWDTMDAVRLIEPHDLQAMQVKPGHVKLLQGALRQYQPTPHPIAPATAGASGPSQPANPRPASPPAAAAAAPQTEKAAAAAATSAISSPWQRWY
eukprot:g75423.t1